MAAKLPRLNSGFSIADAATGRATQLFGRFWDAFATAIENKIEAVVAATNAAISVVTSGGTATISVDPTIDALAQLDTTPGLVTQTGTDAFTKRTLQAGTGISITNPAGVAGDPIIACTVTSPLSFGFILASGATGTNVGPELAALRPGSLTKCVVVTKASDPSTALTFNIKKNGTTIFTSNPSIAGGTSAGTVTDVSSSLASNPLSVVANDVFTIDVTSGNANWAATIELG